MPRIHCQKAPSRRALAPRKAKPRQQNRRFWCRTAVRLRESPLKPTRKREEPKGSGMTHVNAESKFDMN